MNYTANYDLCQWEAGDRVAREDFNADNLAIDTALGTVAAAAAAAQSLASGAAKVATGSYEGTGTYGYRNPISLTFPFAPKLVVFGKYDYIGVLIGGSPAGVYCTAQYHFTENVTWSGNSVSWYNTDSALHQANDANNTFYYAAIG